MAWPVRALPVLQNWDCQGCTDCCRSYRVYLNPDEVRRIQEQDWPDLPQSAITRDGDKPCLSQLPDGACVFLGPTGRCRIHERFGSAAKPLACRLYPFILVPGDREWRVSLRFACPTAAKNEGKPLAEHVPELRALAEQVQRQEIPADAPALPSPLAAVAWDDVPQFVAAFVRLLTDRARPLEHRWRQCLALAALCKQARFDTIAGPRLTEFLQLVTAGLDVPANPADVPAPTWIGRVLFRQVLAALLRHDAGPHRGAATRSRGKLFRAGWHFARGTGAVPELCAPFPPVTFEQLEGPRGALPADADEVLERYYRTKVESLQFCGAANDGLPFWDGLAALAVTLPAILWLRRAFADEPSASAVTRAVAIVDHNFAYSPHLTGAFARFAQRLLGSRGELERLIAWYSR